ncbi:MAG TPA: bacteriohopanetetrol glucosamine biosynthesis glycosyltransferase HpnI [Candidatus Acidoferrales bacterium]|nr:bacteriohopanetetrol glucosamine biosynthesis glycosyltransferase HpnI [Candidatus Acidoferrales bacterium]
MQEAWHFLRWLILALALAPFAFYLLSIWSAVSFFRRPEPGGPPYTPPASILKPCRGLDREAFENFASFCRQNYPQYEILFAVADPADPAVPVIERLMREFPAVPIRLIRSVPGVGANNKVNKLIRLAAEARYDLLVINDSDVRVTPDYLRRVAAPFRDPQVGASTAMYRAETNVPRGGIGAELEAVGITSEFQAGVLTAWRLEGVKFALGATMACTRKALEAIGGFEALADYHSDDYELGSRIAAHGYRVALLRDPVTIVYGRQSLREFAVHQLRWALTTRFARPGGHFGLVLTFGLPWSVLAAAVAPTRWVAAAYLGAYLVLRLAAAWTVGVWGLGDRLLRRRLWLVPLRDATGFLTWIAGYFFTRINWRGSGFRVVEGKLVPVEQPAKAAAAGTAAR